MEEDINASGSPDKQNPQQAVERNRGRFVPGQSGNPKGRPRGKTLPILMRELGTKTEDQLDQVWRDKSLPHRLRMAAMGLLISLNDADPKAVASKVWDQQLGQKDPEGDKQSPIVTIERRALTPQEVTAMRAELDAADAEEGFDEPSDEGDLAGSAD